MRTVLIVSVFCLGLLCPVPSTADWIEVESENFVFIGEVDEDEGRRIVTDLEIYRRTILELAGTRGSPEIRKVHVYGQKRVSDVRALTGRQAAGVYTLGTDSPVFVTLLRGARRLDRSVMLHEYAHHVLNAHTADYFPRWYSEGFAEYLGSFELKDDIVTIGSPQTRFGTTLDNPRWTDIDVVLNSVTTYPFEAGGSWAHDYKLAMFYDISWLAVHYLQNTPHLNRGFGDYVAQLNQGVDPVTAFESAFGITQEEFGDQLRKYWRRDEFPVARFRVTEEMARPETTIRAMTDRQAEIAMAELRALFVSRDDKDAPSPADVRRDLEKLVGKYGPTPALYHALMIVESKDQNYDAAVAIGEKAVALAPDDPRAIQTLADALFQRYRSGGMKHSDDIVRSRALFGRLLDLDPTNPTANSRYPVTFILDDKLPDGKAIEAVAFKARYRRSPRYFDSYLENAEVLLMAGYPEDACFLLSRVDRWIRAADKNISDEKREDIRQDARETDLERLDRLNAETGGRCRTSN